MEVTLLGFDPLTTPVLIDLIIDCAVLKRSGLGLNIVYNRPLSDPERLPKVLAGLKFVRFIPLQEATREMLSPLVLPGIMSGKATQTILEELRQSIGFMADEMHSMIHPSAIIAESANIGAGTWVHPNVTVSTEAQIGVGVTLSRNCSIGHHAVIDDFVKVNPGSHLASEVAVEKGAEIGIGAVCIEGVRIGRRAIIGAGSVVTKDIPDGVVALGVPARIRI